MAELDQDQTIDTGTAEVAPTPLAEILDTSAADVPAQEQEGEAESLGGIDTPQVPLKALRRERERRQRADRQVEELRQELERFDNQKFGFDEPPVEQQQEQYPAGDGPAPHPAVEHYNRSLKNFVDKHGEEVRAKVDAGLRRLNAEQQQHVAHFMHHVAADHPDPVGAIRDYVEQLGLLDFKGQPIADVLASKDKQPQQAPDTSQLERQIAELNRHGQEVAAAEKRTNFLASKTDFVAEYGRGAYKALDEMSTAFVQSDHPAVQQYAHAVASSPDPVSTAAQLLTELGLWVAENPRQQPQQPARTFPSNFSNRRNVGQRSGPTFSGPTPLNDIFKH